MSRRDLALLLAAALIIAGFALFGARYRDEAVDGGWRDLEQVDSV